MNQKSYHPNKGSCFLLLLIFISGYTYADINRDTLFNQIIKEIQTDYRSNTNLTEIEKNITQSFNLFQENGSFSDIDYSSKAQTNWQPLIHLKRLQEMAIGYTSESKYRGNPELYHRIIQGLSYWFDTHPVSTNWFMQQIACPQHIGVILVLMRCGKLRVPIGLENKLLERMETEGGRPDQKGSQGAAANKLAIATHWIYRGCLTKDKEVLSFGIEQAYHPIQLTTEQGIQYDYSYQQHGKQLHIGGYGSGIADEISRLAMYTRNTPYALTDEKLDIFNRFIREAYLPVVRGKFFLYNVLGRGLSRVNALNQTFFIPVLKRMMLLDPSHSPTYQESIDRISGQQSPDFQLQAAHTYFWCSDYTLHQRPEYTFDVRTASIYTTRSENGNGENLKGFFLTEGATTLVKEGNEYENIFSIWDWSKIPGTTTPSMTQIPLPDQWEKPGTSTFAGGVSDGKYGISAYGMDEKLYDVNTQANKSWFFFDNEIVCLGSGINSTSEHEICTTIEQCLLKGDIYVNDKNSSYTLPAGHHFYQNPVWVKYRNTAYLFPEDGDLHISNQSQEGSWQLINQSQSVNNIKEDVFKIWFTHGVKPEQKQYTYIIIPEIKEDPKLESVLQDIEIISNTDSIQAVKHKPLNILGIVFHQPGTFENNDFTIKADKKCICMITNITGNSFHLYLADPARVNDNILLTVSTKQMQKRDINFNLPSHPDPSAGKTFHQIINY